MFKRFDLYLAVFLMVFIIFNTIVLKMRWNGEEEMMDSLFLIINGLPKKLLAIMLLYLIFI